MDSSLDPEGTEPDLRLLEPRPFRPFRSSEEYLLAMREDLSEWLNGLYEGLDLDADNFLEQMETGVVLCHHANHVVRKAREYYRSGGSMSSELLGVLERDVVCRRDVLPETFHARDNVSNFIAFCRRLAIKECLLFETDDLVLRKNERSFILCLLEVARRGCRFGLPAPLLVQMEHEIDAQESLLLASDDGYHTLPRPPQLVTNDLRSLHQRVVELLSRCSCPSQFPMIRVADGKYRIGDTKVLIFVRILRSHVMVRVGGGWDTLEHYLDKHDPCRCKAGLGHRLATSAKLTMLQGKSSIPSMHVTYNRPQQSGGNSNPCSPASVRRGRPIDDSSDDLPESDDELPSDEDAPYRPSHRRRILDRKELLYKDTIPSSWRYSPGIPRKTYNQQQSNGSPRRENDLGSRLPALAPRSDNKLPLKVGKVSPRPHIPANSWPDPHSQSSEDLFQKPASGPAKGLVFHSRGPSPVGQKGARESPSFRRCDPKRHSSPRIQHSSSPQLRSRLSPPRVLLPHQEGGSTNRQSPSRRMFWSPERQPTSKSQADGPSSLPNPVRQSGIGGELLQRLQLREDLTSNPHFLHKVEQLIAEFSGSLPPTQLRRSPVHGPSKSPSKIPLATWY